MSYGQRGPVNKNQPYILFRGGVFSGTANIREATFSRDSLHNARFKQKYYTLVQFDKLPRNADREALAQMGYHLYDYISGNAFLAELPDSITAADLRQYGVSGVYPLPEKYKMAASLAKDPEQYLHENGQLVGVSYFEIGRASGRERV